MLAQEVAKKYANALFDSAIAHSSMDTVHTDLEDIASVAKFDSSLMKFLNTPNVAETAKVQLIQNIFGERVQRLSLEFLLVMIEKKRIAYLPEVIDEFTRLVEAKNGIGRATIITAIPLDESQRSALRTKLSAKTSLKITMEEKVDRSIIGGVIVILHNEIIDGSIQHGLDLVEEQLSKVRVH
ncbi:MAG: ATP synthase F1 subunit delta [bacterium]|nr:ATP synthase F1 subunit delta [bacterium]